MEGKRILDIGCSFGWFEWAAIANKCQYIVGVDRDRKQLLRGGESVKGAHFIQAGVPPLPFPENRFDVVVMWEVIEHLPRKDVVPTLKEIKRVLRGDGSLFLSTPKFDLRSTLTDPAWYFGHRHYTKKELRGILARSGFFPVRIVAGGGFFEVISMLLFYPCKWIGGREVPGKNFLERKRGEEYAHPKSWCTYFVEAEKVTYEIGN
jgi:SAM-dependent methyltransferase